MNYVNDTQTGTKYEQVKGLDKKDIAALIRKDLKGAGIKAQVRLSRFAGGCSIGAYVDPEWLQKTSGGDLQKAKTVLNLADEIGKAYRYRMSNLMTDFYATNFYWDVNVGKPGGGSTMARNINCYDDLQSFLKWVL